MKRIHLFEFEDFAWFPHFLRKCMTRYIVAIHKLLGSSEELAELIAKARQHSSTSKVYDMCSGSGGPMPEVAQILKDKHSIDDIHITLSDLYPNEDAAKEINEQNNPLISYNTTPVDATKVDDHKKGVRTMVCSMHHMRPELAKKILKDAKEAKQPICVFEISDNSMPPVWLWWMVLPINFLMVFFITPMVRPMSWQQIVFTYIIPLIPLFIAWDGAVSNVRTYTINDMEELTSDLKSDDYTWEFGVIKGRSKKAYLLGLPKTES